MARPGPESATTRVKRWFERLASADKVHDQWEDRFKCQRLENYYEGFQWAGVPEEDAAKKYAINLVYGSIETSKPTLLFYRPQYRVAARPGRGDDWQSQAEDVARLAQDTLQTFVDDVKLGMPLHTGLALQEAFFRFGVVEVGYTADYIDNPNAGKPVLKEDETDEDGKPVPMLDGEGKSIPQPERVMTGESLYLKWIPAKQFRVSLSDKNAVGGNDWVGYWEWHYVEDLKRNKDYQNTGKLKPGGVIKETLRAGDRDDVEQHHGMVRVWKVWDLRAKVRHVLAENHKEFLLENQPFDFLPFAVLKFHERLNHFYPIPVVWNWLNPQDEVNDTREQQKVHRQRFNRRYTRHKDAITQDELLKLETGGDGVVAEDNLPLQMGNVSPLTPVPDAPLDQANWRDLAAGKEDFAQVSGISGDQRGLPEASTATQANIVDVRSRLRESSARTKVAEWLGEIGRLILLTIKAKMALPFWIQRNVDPNGPAALEEAVKVTELWKQIEASDLGDLDLAVSVDLASLSPVTEDMQRTSWNQVLMLLSNPALVMLLSQSEVLLRKTLSLYGIRSENEIRAIQQAITPLAQQLAAAQGAASAGQPGAGGVGMPPATPQAITNGQPGGPGQQLAALERMSG